VSPHTAGPAPAALSTGVESVLPDGVTGAVDVLPPGTLGELDCTGDPDSAPELLWSLRAARLPATRALVWLDGEGPRDVAEGFTLVHRVAESVAAHLSAPGEEVGPIEVLVFRPAAPGRPSLPATGPAPAEVGFDHHGGARLRLRLHTTTTTPGGSA